jgi:ABC-type branched-subunit amino acid transport system substrate-binding protein
MIHSDQSTNTSGLFGFYLILLMFILFPALSRAEVKVGVIIPYSGMFSKFGNSVRKGVERGRGEDVKTVYEDEQCLPMPAVQAYKKLAAVDSVKIFFGPTCGSPQTAVAPLLARNNHFAMLGNAAPESVNSLSKGRMFSSQHSIEAESRFVAEQMNNRGIKSVVLVFRDTDFSRTHEAAFKSVFQGNILEVIAFTTEDVSTIRSVALQIKKLNPQVIFSPDATPLILGLTNELTNIGLKKTPLWAVYSTQMTDVLKAVGNKYNSLVYSYPDIGDKDALEFFPQKAMEMLSGAVKACQEKVDCIVEYLKKNYTFNEKGVLEGRLILKTLKNGRFIELEKGE